MGSIARAEDCGVEQRGLLVWRMLVSQLEHYDVLILGSGGGGKLTAWHMAGSGRRTAVVERRWIGGSCPNVACLPSKNEIRSAEVAHMARNAAQFGTLTGPVKVDMGKVRQRKRDMVQGSWTRIYATTKQAAPS
jgi:pyruvate/2-oxoglutarate dehydrogenase complex dihydrolipoamide dehydrogenase (E3) component